MPENEGIGAGKRYDRVDKPIFAWGDDTRISYGDRNVFRLQARVVSYPPSDKNRQVCSVGKPKGGVFGSYACIGGNSWGGKYGGGGVRAGYRWVRRCVLDVGQRRPCYDTKIFRDNALYSSSGNGCSRRVSRWRYVLYNGYSCGQGREKNGKGAFSYICLAFHSLRDDYG